MQIIDLFHANLTKAQDRLNEYLGTTGHPGRLTLYQIPLDHRTGALAMRALFTPAHGQEAIRVKLFPFYQGVTASYLVLFKDHVPPGGGFDWEMKEPLHVQPFLRLELNSFTMQEIRDSIWEAKAAIQISVTQGAEGKTVEILPTSELLEPQAQERKAREELEAALQTVVTGAALAVTVRGMTRFHLKVQISGTENPGEDYTLCLLGLHPNYKGELIIEDFGPAAKPETFRLAKRIFGAMQDFDRKELHRLMQVWADTTTAIG